MASKQRALEQMKKKAKGDNGTARFHRNQTTVTDKKRTIYIGNLDRRVTEYMLIKLFEPFGTITRENYTWHKIGEKRGTPRGYAFIEYRTREACTKAQKAMDGKLCLGRRLTVRYAADKEYEDDLEIQTMSSTDRRQLARQGKGGVRMSAADKIRAIEEKLRKMRDAQQNKYAPPAAKKKKKEKNGEGEKSEATATSKQQGDDKQPSSSSSSGKMERVKSTKQRPKPYDR
uniref:RRM domain-containing protein n=1 Tax=Lotharella oceanica TaxID=641309 RepID=A0A7S2U1G1_9EUKA|mmetsp:Transcript_3773/g.7249  ORF Transcript_3773/g.7249 Transcript_3773/m.7249 type:complete len:230 (+) Transcript_3773:1276-1965(+)|eukprot:CAMPEP_0170180396 /NCGR_PEP_ID=MMETSP0040_2-20121228/21901_1 /TAXON_ID=641309 /ORGANISM="Lotharella oceanica, Strain CCMP622" /LENGTH=229 /DNA_ID=CAMNT_0010425019 /DNA_START=273 /DNA_END=962 /DNA_ORIENTATION=+